MFSLKKENCFKSFLNKKQSITVLYNQLNYS